MIKLIKQWLITTNTHHAPKRKSCSDLPARFEGWFSADYLAHAGYVVSCDTVPKPEIPKLELPGLETFLTMPAAGITYNDTYYVLDQYKDNMRLHFHELVHVAQWQILGIEGFITRYIREIQQYGYHDAPLEKMAYALDEKFANGDKPFDVVEYVRERL